MLSERKHIAKLFLLFHDYFCRLFIFKKKKIFQTQIDGTKQPLVVELKSLFELLVCCGFNLGDVHLGRLERIYHPIPWTGRIDFLRIVARLCVLGCCGF